MTWNILRELLKNQKDDEYCETYEVAGMKIGL